MGGEKDNMAAGKTGMKRFDKAFKIQAVKMATEEGQKTLRGNPFFGNPLIFCCFFTRS